MKKYIVYGALLATVSLLNAVSYDLDFEQLFFENRTDHDVVVRFFNQYNQQQLYPLNPHEHRYVRVKEGVMKKLYSIRVTMHDPETNKIIMREIDYDPDQDIIGLKIKMNPDLELNWIYEDEEPER